MLPRFFRTMPVFGRFLGTHVWESFPVLGVFGAFLGDPFVYEQVRGGHLSFQGFCLGAPLSPHLGLRAISGTYMYVPGAVLEVQMAPRSYQRAESMYFYE